MMRSIYRDEGNIESNMFVEGFWSIILDTSTRGCG